MNGCLEDSSRLNDSAFTEPVNISSDEMGTINQLAKIIKRMTNSKSKIVHIPYDKAFEKGFEDMRRRVPDITKLGNYIGYKPMVSLEDSIERIISYYRE